MNSIVPEGSFRTKRSFWLRLVLWALFGAILYVGIHAYGAHSEGYRFLDRAIRESPSIRERVGEVKSVRLSFFGHYWEKASGDNQWVAMTLVITGEKGSGTVVAEAKKKNGVWSVTTASMDGSQISLTTSVVR